MDSLRALAAIAILVVHTAIFSGAAENETYGRFLVHLDIGVPFFFLLSAFLLYRPFVAARVHRSERTSLGSYARRRFLRIAPAYWLALTVTALVPGMAGAFTGDWWVYYGLLQNLPVYTADGTCADDAFLCAVPPAWSLAVEVGFYLTLPLFVLAMDGVAARWRGRSWLTPELLAVAGLAAVSIAIQSSTPTSELDLWLFYSPLGRGLWFGLGLALAAISVRDQAKGDATPWTVRIRRSPGVPLAIAAVLYLIACYVTEDALVAFPIGSESQYLLQYVLFGVIATLVMLPAVFGQDGRGAVRRVLGHRTLAWLGKVSYGIFLYHFGVMIFLLEAGILDLWPGNAFGVLALTTLALSVCCAAVSFYALERPLMRWARSRPGSSPGGSREQPLPEPAP